MSQRPVEVILTRQLAEYLSTPVFVVDPAGDLLFYNEAAEEVLGARFEETGPMPAEAWSRAFEPTDRHGKPLSPDRLPLVQTLQNRLPASGRLNMRGLDGTRRDLEIASFPLLGQGGRFLGAVAMFWTTGAAE